MARVLNIRRSSPRAVTTNAEFSLLRASIASALLGRNGRDVNKECDYPDQITTDMYHEMFSREGLAKRVVTIWPEECFVSPPAVYETEDPDQETEFEKQYALLDKRLHLSTYYARVDMLSGIGRFGVLLLGIDDGLELQEPVDGVTVESLMFDGSDGAPSKTRKLLYVRAFEENVVNVTQWEKDVTNPRFGRPVMYSIKIEDDAGSSQSLMVHWSRVVHIADNRAMSEIYGTPRMQECYNRLLDARKILGGAGEGQWRNAIPRLALESTQDDAELDQESVEAQMLKYTQGLQPYLALVGMRAKTISGTGSDPRPALEAVLESLAVTLGIPKRVLIGSEQAQLASSQDAKRWNSRVQKRRDDYVTPMLIRPVVDRLIMYGVLPMPTEYGVDWPDLEARSDEERGKAAKAWADAFASYARGEVESIIAPSEFFSMFAGLDMKQIEQIQKGLEEWVAETEDDEVDPEVDPDMVDEEEDDEEEA